jgi:hypothetical protein
MDGAGEMDLGLASDVTAGKLQKSSAVQKDRLTKQFERMDGAGMLPHELVSAVKAGTIQKSSAVKKLQEQDSLLRLCRAVDALVVASKKTSAGRALWGVPADKGKYNTSLPPLPWADDDE